MADSLVKIVASRHSAFYSPLIAAVAGGFLEREGLRATYRPLRPGERSRELLGGGEADVMQSAVGSNWAPLEAGETDLPVHFAQINTRDGFFLLARKGFESFRWSDLEGRTLLADHGHQPLLMLRYAAEHQGVNWGAVDLVDAGDPEAMVREFRGGRGDFVHLQGPAPQQLQAENVGGFAVSVGQAMPPVAFSSLCARRDWLETEPARAFTRAYRQAREWVRQTPAAEVAAREAEWFPEVSREALAGAIAEYQLLGCWEGELEIPPDLYEQALEVFLAGGAIRRRHSYESTVVAPPA